MKKFLSFMLVLAMIASMMCINVAAADEAGEDEVVETPAVSARQTTHLVGTYGEGNGNNGIEDGVASGVEGFSKTNASVVQVSVDGTTHNRYAVDLLYTSMAITITSDATWNVDTLKYDGTMSIKVGDANAQSLTNGTAVQGVGLFTITNYSDDNVEVAVTVENTNTLNAENEKASIATTTKVYETTSGSNNAGNEVTSDNRSTIAGVTPQVNAPGTAVTATYRADLNCDDWAANFATLSGQRFNVARITFTVSVPQTTQGEQS